MSCGITEVPRQNYIEYYKLIKTFIAFYLATDTTSNPRKSTHSVSGRYKKT